MKKKRVNGYLIAGCAIAGALLLLTILGAFWTPHSITGQSGAKFEAPSLAHLFGTDKLGRDIFSRVLRGMGAR